jgi:hypothetical protein
VIPPPVEKRAQSFCPLSNISVILVANSLETKKLKPGDLPFRGELAAGIRAQGFNGPTPDLEK